MGLRAGQNWQIPNGDKADSLILNRLYKATYRTHNLTVSGYIPPPAVRPKGSSITLLNIDSVRHPLAVTGAVQLVSQNKDGGIRS